MCARTSWDCFQDFRISGVSLLRKRKLGNLSLISSYNPTDIYKRNCHLNHNLLPSDCQKISPKGNWLEFIFLITILCQATHSALSHSLYLSLPLSVTLCIHTCNLVLYSSFTLSFSLNCQPPVISIQINILFDQFFRLSTLQANLFLSLYYQSIYSTALLHCALFQYPLGD